MYELIDEKKDRNSSKIQIRIDNIKGKVDVQFYSCDKKDAKECYLDVNRKEGDKDIKKYLPKSVESSKVQKTYHFDIDWNLFSKEKVSSS